MKRSRLRSVSKKKTRLRNSRQLAIDICLERDQGCIMRGVGPVECAGRLHAHEPLSRARGGDPCNPAQVITLCAAHHHWTHDGDPKAATEAGLSISGGVLYENGRYLKAYERERTS